ncbi:flagellar basal body rod modification protein FlgD [Alkalihalobacillus alcalophilus ATCC 27647 = CGMCC 1.3604]|uniref:Flagellar basal body rod modification protein FlgD n=1 Tax=Alkalihalobacillus alcalophilus ATCC 27647 = CGMCC 1.3604 TaxID=1218173 RepID=A0A094YXM0_ALKAL|nr:flagellar hook assembly protein FlgD [Alkalihalobacillus alcalophilus]KGA98247.1 flagellar basal body rod modification protein FlgD [Alkalihalobacillus alcalophilus ATCC 27647 = CGMCC 1.3604]MED1562186.1 flagellar hook assembly protein FlgD [Alkalihalobacillus alcalophilus]THG91411.1 flagellar basal body rod modification protein FlgD [Alkalihalobacillus alcalophilus ATCC 27647 = CGMCC 1.3604]
MTTINNNLWLSSIQNQPTQSSGSNMLGKDDFLKLLITQMQNQDPTNPMDDREFISQMAQFSSLEQMTNLNQSMQYMVDMQITQSLVTHSQLIGKNVQWMQLIDNENGVGHDVQYLENAVKSVKIETDGSLRLLLDNNTWISNFQLVQVEPVSTPPEESGSNDGNDDKENEVE